jgi:hypothetical protein
MYRGRNRGFWSPRNTPDVSIQKLFPSAVFQNDATLAASYDGTSQLLKNIIPRPATGLITSALDFTLGADASVAADDPTFVGTAGNPAAYFEATGTQLFRLASGANPPVLDNLHKNNVISPFTLICCFNPSDQIASNILMATTITTADLGVRINLTGTENLFLAQNDGTVSLNLGTPIPLTISQPVLAIYSWDGTTSAVTSTHTFNTATGAASSPFVLFRNLAALSRFYGSAFFAEAITTNGQAAAIFDYYNPLHQRTYA